MKIGILTYQSAHLKTAQILSGLLSAKKHELHIFAQPLRSFKPRQPLFEHRPHQFVGDDIADIARREAISYTAIADDSEVPSGMDIYVVAGAGLLSPECVRGKRILNVHPGVIPLVRGLDAFKWTILGDYPLGLTLHFIDARADMGDILTIVPTPVYQNDTITQLAARHYEAEIRLLIDFERHLSQRSNPFAGAPEQPAHRRMPLAEEQRMLAHFDAYKHQHALKEKTA